MSQNLKGHGDAQTYDSANIEFFHDFHIFYISYESYTLKNFDVQK